MDHGRIDRADWTRICREHGRHGWLYPCPAYDQETLAEIAQADIEYRQMVNDPAWIERQREAGIPAEVLAIFQILAGPPDGKPQ